MKTPTWLGPGGTYAFAVLAALSLLGRLNRPFLDAAVLGSLVVAALVWNQDRHVALWFTGVLAAIWVSQRPPWEPLVSSVVVAGVVLLLYKAPEGTPEPKVAAGAFLFGTTAALTSAVIHYGSGFEDVSAVLGLTVLIVTLRLGAVALLAEPWVAAVWMAAVAVPGQTGLLSAAPIAVETAGVLFIGANFPASSRVFWAIGGVAAAWPIWFL